MGNVIVVLVLVGGLMAAPVFAGPWISAAEIKELVAPVKKEIEAQKFNAALEKTKKLVSSADPRISLLGRSLRVQVMLGMHRPETVVEELIALDLPKDDVAAALHNWLVVQALENYTRTYQWEIQNRERTTGEGRPADLKAWTIEDIDDEINARFVSVWQHIGVFEDYIPADFAHFAKAGNYPDDIRPTMRDMITYLMQDYFRDTSFWSPREQNQVEQLNFNALLNGSAKRLTVGLDADAHPLAKAVFLLAAHEELHSQNKRQGAALEARLQRVQALFDAFTSEERRRALIQHIEKSLAGFGDTAWSSVARAVQGRMCEQTDYPGHLIDAHRFALLGMQRGKGSIGGEMSAALVARIERPSLTLQTMSVDTTARPSVAISYKNIQQINLRLVAGDIKDLLSKNGNYGMQPSQDFLKSQINKTPVRKWSQELAPTIDFKSHRAFAELPAVEAGVYYLIASTTKSFGSDGYVVGQMVIVSDYVIRRESLEDWRQVFAVYRGDRGAPVQGADLQLYKFAYGKKMEKVASKKTDKKGQAEFGVDRTSGQLYALALVGGQWTGDTGAIWANRLSRVPDENPQIMVYTDRSIYRPGQTVSWKIQAVHAGRKGARPWINQSVSVALQDANGEAVATKKVTTNRYGTASGEFVLPTGRALGHWTLVTSHGSGYFQVEEYKRPTMKAEFLPSTTSLQMNHPVVLSGSASYYFGAPVSEGKVQWTVTREPIYFGWWNWYGSSRARAEMIAAGNGAVSSDGKFTVNFLPTAARPETTQERAAVQYNFRIEATVTDSGGESIELSSVLRMGWVDLDVAIASPGAETFWETKGTTFHVQRNHLSGSPAPGVGKWKLYRLQQPESTTLRLPLPQTGDSQYALPGDTQRTRWDQAAATEEYLARWNVGDVVAEDDLLHGDDGKAEVKLGMLQPTAYRLQYQSDDGFGEPYQISKDFFVLGENPNLKIPFYVEASKSEAVIGETVTFSLYSAVKDMPIHWALYQEGRKYREGMVAPGGRVETVRVKIDERMRGGFNFKASALADYLPLQNNVAVHVGWPEKELAVKFTTIRERLRPGQKEVWKLRIEGSDGQPLQSAAEVLALMYDKSLDVFNAHSIPNPLSLLPRLHNSYQYGFGLHAMPAQWIQGQRDFGHKVPPEPQLVAGDFSGLSGEGIGGLGRRGSSSRKMTGVSAYSLSAAGGEMAKDSALQAPSADAVGGEVAKNPRHGRPNAEPGQHRSAPNVVAVRSDFRETAFWFPQLVSGAGGTVEITFAVPDAVTEWQVFIGAVTKALQYGMAQTTVRTAKDLLVRPYLPRYLRAGDENEIRVVVNNTSKAPLQGNLTFVVEDPQTGSDISSQFGLSGEATAKTFAVAAGESQALLFSLKIPQDLGEVAVRVTGVAGEFGDAELRRLPVLPARMHLAQSRFAALTTTAPRELKFALAQDKTRIDEQLVVSVDAQLIGGVVKALPYLATYPYECVEQTLNRFLSAAIVESAFGSSPYIKSIGEQMKGRKTQFESWEALDPNRKMQLEETPWLNLEKGGSDADALLNVFDPQALAQQRASSLDKLAKAQLEGGGFPWFPGGRASNYMTLYLLGGFARAQEFGVAIDPGMVSRALGFVAEEYRQTDLSDHALWYVVQLNFISSSFGEDIGKKGVSLKERRAILDFTFSRRSELPPYLKAILALTLHRMDRHQDAVDLLEVIFDTAVVDKDLGMFWAPEDRSWLWYNDTIEAHAFALRALTEILPNDERRKPLVQWIFLNKKLNHWQSTRTTAEVLYSLIYYLKTEDALDKPESVIVKVGDTEKTFAFSPKVYQGDNMQWVIKDQLASDGAKTVVARKPQGEMAFVNATWHFSTENPPPTGDGDLFSVSRRYFKRQAEGVEMKLTELDDAQLVVGDEIEVHLSITAKHAAEYVHLRDPRPAGFEAGIVTSGWRWNTGLSYFEETRDSGINFFFEWLPAGEFTLKYRVRVQGAGSFQASPATLQSMYAPEFTAYSGARRIEVQ